MRRPAGNEGRRPGRGRIAVLPPDGRPGGAGPVARAGPRPPAPPQAARGDRDRDRVRDRDYRRGRGAGPRDGRDYRRDYGRGYGRVQRPGHWYGWDYRRGYGYHRYGLRYRSWYAPHAHIHYPGYTHGHVYGSHFFAPGFSFGVGGSGYGYGGAGSFFPGYGYYPSTYHPTDLHTGFLRLRVHPRLAQVFIDGYFVGVVNEFDGVFQRLRLEEGPHQVEIVHPDFEPLELDILIVPGEKVTFEGDLIPLP